MSTITGFSTWREDTGSNHDAGAPAGSDYGLSHAVQYIRADDASVTDVQRTYGNQTATRRDVFSYGSGGNRVHCILFWWDMAAVDARADTIIRHTSAQTQNMLSTETHVQDVSQTEPYGPGDSNLAAQGFASGGLSVPFVSPTIAGAAAQGAACLWIHSGTTNRSHTTDPLWTEHSKGNASTMNCDRGLSTSVGGNQTFTLTQNIDDSFFTQLTIVEFSDVATGLSVTALNTDNTLSPDRQVEEGTGNLLYGSGFTVNGGVTGIEIESDALPGFISQPFDNGSDIISDGELTFSTQMDGSPSLPYGPVTLRVLHPDGNLDFTGTIPDPTALVPPEDSSYNTVSGVAPAALQKNAFDSLTVTDGDQYEWADNSSLGHAVVVNPTGTYTIDAGGISPQSVLGMRVRQASNNDQWSAYYQVNVNHKPVITDVAGFTFLSGATAADATNIPVNGSQFGHAQYDFDVWVTPIDQTDLKGLKVKQTVSAWADTQVTVAFWDLTGLPGASQYAVVVGRAN